MNRTKQLLGAVSAIALVAMSSAPASAAGTTAGDTITNNVIVTYEVGGVEQTQEEASDSFLVDRKIDVTVAFTGTSATEVNPGEQNVVLAFDVTNLSNATIDLSLAALLNGGTGDDADIDDENFQYYIDVNEDGQLDAGDTLITDDILDEVAEDQTIKVLVVTNIGLDAANGETFDVVLTANALEDDGSEITATFGGDTADIDTVLADGAGTTDAVEAGDFSDEGTYIVAGALLTVLKISTVIEDPINVAGPGGTPNPNAKAIPGATVEYCITVANAAGGAEATNVNVVDDLPADVTYLASFGIFVDGDASCANGVAGGSFNTGSGPLGEDQVRGDLSDIPAATTRSLYFRVTIN